MKFSLVHPSRGRAQQAFDCFIEWTEKCSGTHQYEYILSLDKSDPALDEYLGLFDRQVNITINDNKNCVQATNQAAKSASGDVLVYVSDDFGCPIAWDEHLKAKAPDTDKYLLWVEDGIQGRNTVVTIPIISMGLYKHLGYFWHPAYESMWVDVDLYFTCLPYIVDCKDLLFEHRHYSVGKAEYDDTYKAHDNNERTSKGKAIFNQRSKEEQWGKRF